MIFLEIGMKNLENYRYNTMISPVGLLRKMHEVQSLLGFLAGLLENPDQNEKQAY